MHLTAMQLDRAVEQARRYARTVAHLDLNADPQGQGSIVYKAFMEFWKQFHADAKLSLAIGWNYGKEYGRITRLYKLARQEGAAVGSTM